MNYEHFDQITSQQSYIGLSSVAVGMQTHNSLNLIHLTPFISQCFSQNQPITSIIYFLLQGQTAHRKKKHPITNICRKINFPNQTSTFVQWKKKMGILTVSLNDSWSKPYRTPAPVCITHDQCLCSSSSSIYFPESPCLREVITICRLNFSGRSPKLN